MITWALQCIMWSWTSDGRLYCIHFKIYQITYCFILLMVILFSVLILRRRTLLIMIQQSGVTSQTLSYRPIIAALFLVVVISTEESVTYCSHLLPQTVPIEITATLKLTIMVRKSRIFVGPSPVPLWIIWTLEARNLTVILLSRKVTEKHRMT